MMREQHGTQADPQNQYVLSVEKGQRRAPCCNESLARCPLSEDKKQALRYLAEIIVNSYLRDKGL